MRRFLVVFTIIQTILLTGCDFIDDKLIVTNGSKDSIAFIIPAEPNYFPTFDDSKETTFDKQLNDSLLNVIAKYDPNGESHRGVHFLVGDSTKHIITFNVRWEQIVDQTPDKKLKILFFPASVMTSGKYKWKDIYDNKLLEEKTFTVDELDKLNWTVKFLK